jgi:hypothetical protein
MLRELEADGWITTFIKQGGYRNTPIEERPNLYKINMGEGSPTSRGRAHERAGGGLAHEQGGGLANEPVTILNTSDTSSIGSPERARKSRSKKPDTLFDALTAVCELDPSALTSSARGAINKAVKELRDVDATAEAIEKAATAFAKKWPDIAITPSALAKHYPTLIGFEARKSTPTAIQREICQPCQGTGWVEVPDEHHTSTRCPSCWGAGFAPDPEA